VMGPPWATSDARGSAMHSTAANAANRGTRGEPTGRSE
jgi:hypothetical protein